MLELTSSPVVMSWFGTSGTSSAKTTAKPLRQPKRSSSAQALRREERDDERSQVPVDMAMEEPWTRVVSVESDGDIVTRISYAHDVADDRINEVVGRVPGAPDHIEVVPM